MSMPSSRSPTQYHPTRGGWIEILSQFVKLTDEVRPTPHGVGGLKYIPAFVSPLHQLSHPTRGGWIEIVNRQRQDGKTSVPPHTGWVD